MKDSATSFLRFFLTVAAVFTATATLFAAELDPAYPATFGWGTVLVSQRGPIAKDSYDPAQLTFQNGKYIITSGEDVELNFRILLKNGKTYGQYVSALKQANAEKMKTYKEDFMQLRVWVSHDYDGNQLYEKWPEKLDDKPVWHQLMKVETGIENALDWNGSQVIWSNIQEASGKLQQFLSYAKPGYRIYFMTVAGFIRDAPELRYYDNQLLRWMTPIQYVETWPLAASTVEIVAGPEADAEADDEDEQ